MRSLQAAQHELARRRETGVEVHRGDDRFERVGEDRLLGAAAGRVLALAEQQVRRRGRARCATSASTRAFTTPARTSESWPSGRSREVLEHVVRDDEPEHASRRGTRGARSTPLRRSPRTTTGARASARGATRSANCAPERVSSSRARSRERLDASARCRSRRRSAASSRATTHVDRVAHGAHFDEIVVVDREADRCARRARASTASTSSMSAKSSASRSSRRRASSVIDVGVDLEDLGELLAHDAARPRRGRAGRGGCASRPASATPPAARAPLR